MSSGIIVKANSLTGASIWALLMLFLFFIALGRTFSTYVAVNVAFVRVCKMLG